MTPFVRRICLWAFIWTGLCFLSVSWAADSRDDRIIMDEEQIKESSARTIYELLNHIPGVKATSTSVSIRGSLKVLVLLDQRSINDLTSTYGGVRWDVVELPQIRQIVILRGNGGVEYGDNASGGVIDITTRKIDHVQARIEAKAGNLSTREVKASVTSKEGRLGLGLNAGLYDTEGFRVNGDKKTGRIEGRMNYDKGGITIGASGFFWQEDKGNPGLPAYPTPLSRGKNQAASGVLNLKWTGWKSKTFANFGNKETFDPDKDLDSYLRVLRVGQEVSSTLVTDLAGKISWGTGLSHATAKSGDFDEKTEEKAFVYAATSTPLSFLPLTLHTGLRGIYYSEYDNSINPEVSLTLKKGGFSGKISAGRTSNAPSFTKKYRRTSTTLPNPDLTIEKATNFSVTLAFEASDTVSFSLSPFYNMIDDRITYVRNGGVGRYENFGEVTYKGVDVGVSLKPLSWMTLKSSYTYLEAKDENTDLMLSAKARHRWVNTLEIGPLERFTMGLTATATSNAFGNSANTEVYPGSLVLDLKAEYAFETCSLILEIENLMDTNYMKLDGYPAAPLTFLAGMRYRF